MLRNRIIYSLLLGLLYCADGNAESPSQQDPIALFRVVRVEAGDVLHIRRTPDPGAKIAGSVPPHGEGVMWWGERRKGETRKGSLDWFKVRYRRTTGWVNSHYLERDPALFRVVRVAADDVLYMRSQPAPKADIVAAIPPDGVGIRWLGGKESVGRGTRAHDWLRVRYGDAAGWVNSHYLEREPTLFRVVRVAPGDVLYIRALAAPEAKITGAIPPDGTGVLWLGNRQAVGSYDWYKIKYGEAIGWVNSHYLERQ